MSSAEPTIAYLGPAGSYTHGALCAYCDAASASPEVSIRAVFEAVANKRVQFGCVPLENMLEGPVAETWDGLLAYRGAISLVDSVTQRIDHCIGVLTSCTDVSQVTTVYSHSQALRQCAAYLDSAFPNAARISCTSTAAAVQRVIEEGSDSVAAIASERALTECGLRIHQEKINNSEVNKTRFAIVAARDVAPPPLTRSRAATSRHTTSIVVDPGRDRQGILHEILQVISIDHRCNITSIHSRPDQRGGFVFFLDIEGSVESEQISAALEGLEVFCRESTGATASVINLGSYPCEPFHTPAFSSVGILGSEGAMGRWFSQFFASLGFTTIGCDKESALTLEDVVSKVDVVLISTPMSEMPEISDRLASCVRANQLIVENASIKHSSIPLLASQLPDSVEVLGIHTMFGEQTERIRDQNIIVTRTDSGGPLALAFEDLLYKQGARLHFASVEEHDKASASLQALLHLLLLSTASVLEKEWDHVTALDSFTTPTARPLLAAMKRVAAQSDSLLKDMQLLNPQSERMRHLLLAELCRQVFSIDQKECTPLNDAVSRVRKFFAE